jgi:hypothetical protein
MPIVKLNKDTNLKEYHISNDKQYVAEVVKRKWNSKWYKIKCDDNFIREFSSNHFVSIEEIRDDKLNSLGI